MPVQLLPASDKRVGTAAGASTDKDLAKVDFDHEWN
jgi:hypothetical protein